MTYRETLNKAQELHINPFDLIVVEQLINATSLFNLKLTDRELEKACESIKEAYFEADENITFWKLAQAYCDLKLGHQPTTTKRIINLSYNF